MSYQRSDQSFCYTWGRFGELLWWLALLQPVLLWTVFCARGLAGHRAQRSYYRMQTASVLFAWLFNYVLRDGVFRSPVPHPECSSVRFSRPGLEVMLMAHYLVAIALHSRYFGWPYGVWNWAWALVQFLIVYGLASTTGNYTQPDLLVGLAVGVLHGLTHGYLIFALFVPLLPLSYFFWFYWWNWYEGFQSAARWLHADYASERDKLRAHGAEAAEWAAGA